MLDLPTPPKCDENRPSCSTCTSLKIDCHSYGPRPEGMDRAALEREQAQKVKRIISQTKWQRRQRRLRRTWQHLGPVQDPLLDGQTSSLGLPLPSPIKGAAIVQGVTPQQDHPELQINEGDLGSFNEQMWSEPIYDSILLTESFFNQEGSLSVSTQRLSGAATGIENADMESVSVSSASSDSSVPTSSRVYDTNDRDGIEVYGGAEVETNADGLVSLDKPKLGASYHDN